MAVTGGGSPAGNFVSYDVLELALIVVQKEPLEQTRLVQYVAFTECHDAHEIFRST